MRRSNLAAPAQMLQKLPQRFARRRIAAARALTHWAGTQIRRRIDIHHVDRGFATFQQHARALALLAQNNQIFKCEVCHDLFLSPIIHYWPINSFSLSYALLACWKAGFEQFTRKQNQSAQQLNGYLLTVQDSKLWQSPAGVHVPPRIFRPADLLHSHALIPIRVPTAKS